MTFEHLKIGGLIAGAAAVLSGCAAFASKTTFITTPGEATIRLSTGGECRTPCALPMPSEGAVDVEITKVGFKTQSYTYRLSRLRPAPAKAAFDLELVAPTIPIDTAPLEAPVR